MIIILFVIGVVVCLPKLLGNKDNKAGYIAAAEWISANTAADAVIAVPDKRISFYGERKGILLDHTPDLQGECYLVKIVEGDKKAGEVSYWLDQHKKTKVVVYRSSEQ